MARGMLWLVGLIACGGDDTPAPVDDTEPGAVDEDGDGFGPDEDCDDRNGAAHPGAEEVCDGVDNNCDGAIDEGVEITIYLDADRDGYGNDATVNGACEVPDGVATVGGDCDDSNADISPGAQEVCNTIDDDCDALIDDADDSLDPSRGELFYVDGDGDGFGEPGSATLRCAAADGWVSDGTDCDDTQGATYPGAEEVCDDGVVSDCDQDIEQAIAECDDEIDYEVDAVVEGSDEDASFGLAVAGGFDHNGDGYDDIVISSLGAVSASVFYGGTAFGGELRDTDADATVDAGDFTDSVGFSIAAAADMDGDGCDEIVLSHIGGPTVDGRAYEAAVFIVSGGQAEASVDEAPVRLLSDVPGLGYHLGAGDLGGDGDGDVFASDGTDTLLVYRAPEGDVTAASASLTDAGVGGYLGSGSTVVDVDGDGAGELLVNAPFSSDDEGFVYLFASPVLSGAVDWDDADVTIREDGNRYFGLAVDRLGDANGDGYEDLVVADYTESLGLSDGSAAYVFWGPLSGSLAPADAGAFVASADSSLLGYDVAGVGDVDGDGLGDMVLSDPYANSGDHGGARLFYGDELDGTVSSSAGRLLDRSAYREGRSYFSLVAAAAGDLNGDGYADMLNSSHQDNLSRGAASVTFGQPRY